MTPIDQEMLHSEALRAYEAGRWRHGLSYAVYVLPMIALSLWVSVHVALSLAVGALLLVLVALFTARGGMLGRVVTPGLIAGSPPLLLPLFLRSSGHCCIGGTCWSGCLLACLAGGLLAGIIVGSSARDEQQRGTFVCGATLIAGLSGMLGCVMAGAAGVTVMMLAALAASVPTVMLARTRTRT